MKLRVFLPATDRLDDSAPLAWMLFDARGELMRQGASPPAEIPGAGQVEAVLPASRVLFARLKLPRVNAATIRELLPYAVEDRLLADPAHIHAVAGAKNDQGETVVAVVDREWVEAMLRGLAAHGLLARQAWCESALLAGGKGDWHVVLDANLGFLVDDDGVAAAFDRSNAAELPLTARVALDEAGARGARPVAVRVHAKGAQALPDLARWSEQAGLPFTAGTKWETLAAGGIPANAIQLLSGELALRLAPAAAPRVPRAALVLAVALAALQLAFTAIDTWRLSRQRDGLAQQQEALFRATFPEAKVVVDPALQMARNLAELKRSRGLSSDDDFLAQATRAAREFPSGSVKTLTYSNGRMEAKR